jgi:glutamate-1-semialdehyde 2,1-aminomutase
MPHLEMIRFTNSGSEGTRTAIRAARAFTGKDKIAKFEGNYHGSDDYFLISCETTEVAGPDDSPKPVLDCPGVPLAIADTVLILPYNDTGATKKLLRKHGHELAAVIMEAVAVTHGGTACAEPEFLETVRQITQEEGMLLIFDEIVTGFRLGFGGAAAYFGVTPDLAVIGKAIAGGFPIGAFGGRQDIMEQVLSPISHKNEGKKIIFHSGTFTGNPISMVAGLATLDELEKTNPYPHMEAIGDQLRNGLRNLFEQHGIPIQVTGVGSIYNILFSENLIKNRRDVLKSNLSLQGEFCLGLIVKGVLQPIRHAGFLSAAHTADDVNQFLDATEDLISEMKSQGMFT